ncbi:conserved hypothetical protein [metagenome]|uniref:Winged helix DNA-binding domain-containing protein n=1 Tax=metagenome TaxID=256318 RepID=A0A2P2C321_9ZZZZ
MRTLDDTERRNRIAQRHGIAPARRLSDPVAATRAMTVLHATEPASVLLSLFARVDGLSVEEVEKALYVDRTLVKQLAMRRTLFVFPRDLLPAAWGSAAARVADTERARMIKDVTASGLTADGAAWVEAACAAVLERLAEGPETAQRLREQLPEIQGTVVISPGTTWGGEIPIAPRVLTQLGARGRIVRGRNTGHWRVSRPEWTLMESWLGSQDAPLPTPQGYAELVARWLWTFGPAPVSDLKWWLGSTLTAARRALADVGAVEVATSSGPSYVLPDDLEPAEPLEPWAALLPVLDPTVMGWKQREFFLGPHEGALFDRNGNAGTTAWWDGRVVGCWAQDPDGVVQVRCIEGVGADGRAALAQQAERLTDWLDGVRVGTVYPSPLMKAEG